MIKPFRNADAYGFSNRVECAVATQSCSGGSGSGKAAKKMAKMLFSR